MKNFRICSMTLVISSLLAVPITASADDWKITFAPYLWAVSIDGDTPDIDASFGDILSNANFAGSFHTELKNDKWSFVLDPTYISLEVDAPSPPSPSGNADITIWLVELWTSYEIIDHWELLAGARYQDQEISGLIPGPDIKDDWTDWFAGVRYITDLTDKWFISARGDVAFAGDSDSSWNAQVIFTRRIGENMGLNLGYRHFADDYDNAPTYVWDVEQSGPVVGYTWVF